MGSITRLDREDFLESYWPMLYKPGQHVLTLGPTQRAGKSFLNMQLLEASAPEARKVILCMKPSDKTVAGWTGKLGYREVATWPPRKRFWESEPNGYTVWPKHVKGDLDATEKHLKDVFHRTIMDCYEGGVPSIINMDEIYGLCVELKLQKEVLAVLTRGGGMGCGAFVCSQRPSGTAQGSLPGPVLSQPYHMFLANESDKRQRDRYGEISGGFDPDFIESTTLNLPQYHFLYLNADGESAVIGP
jgi:hypothetical protein